MKCLILAGGRGERLWPLSRNNFPKQFIKVQKNHSIFQETIARNMAYCDEFIIVTNYAYKSIIANQMEAFQGVSYHSIYEEEPHGTTAAITLSCLYLQPSEYVFVVSSNHLIDTGDCDGYNYKDSILKAKELAKEGDIVLFGKKTAEISGRFGYFTEDGQIFVEKPDRKRIKVLQGKTVCQNLGMLLFQNGVFLNELKSFCPDLYTQCKNAHGQKVNDGVLYRDFGIFVPIPIERSIIEKTEKKKGLVVGFDWNDISSLEDLSATAITTEGTGIINECMGTTVINQSPHQAVVVNDLDNVLVVNTTDAVYIGRKGKSYLLKEILHDNPALEPYTEQGRIFYRPWGYYEQLVKEEYYKVRKVVLLPGKTICKHSHEKRTESWTIICGQAKVTLNRKSQVCKENDHISILPGTIHQISNIGEECVLFIETATGDIISAEDVLTDESVNVTETGLGLKPDPMVKLAPAFKDYLWGGTKLRSLYNKQCDFDIIAESWELSAHPAGNSTIASGRHKGLSFSKYLEIVGREVLGWKCFPLQSFPLLIKFIDAKENLSVQVHPDDDYALEKENEYGKNEMWYVIDSNQDAGLYMGFNRDTDRNEVARRAKDGTLPEILNFYPTHPGDVFFIPAGTVHAIGAGNLICEIQQSSNSTYRLYDYGRKDKFGNQRELHLDKALDVLDYKKYRPIELDKTEGRIRCKYFEVEVIELKGETKVPLTDDSFYALTCLKGMGKLILDGEMKITEGETIFIPATQNTLIIQGKGSLMIART